MFEVQISISSIDKVKEFVKILSRFEGEFEVLSGKYIVDAKSILGLFSVDLSKPVILKADAEDAKREEILNAISKYRV